MVRVRGYIRADPNSGSFVNVAAHERRRGRYLVEVTPNSDVGAQVSIHDRETGAYRALFVGSVAMGEAIARAIRAGAVRPAEGFLR